MEMKYCPHCGQMNEKDAKFCVHCGGAQEYVVPGQNVAKGMEQFGKEVSSSVQDLTQRVQTNENIQKGMKEAQVSWTYLLEKVRQPNIDTARMPVIYPYIIVLLLGLLPNLPVILSETSRQTLGMSFVLSSTTLIIILHAILLSVTYFVLKFTVKPTLKYSELLKQYSALLSPLVLLLAIIIILNLILGTVQLFALAVVIHIVFVMIAINSLIHFNYPADNKMILPFYYVNIINFIVLTIILFFVISVIGESFFQNLISQISRNINSINILQ